MSAVAESDLLLLMRAGTGLLARDAAKKLKVTPGALSQWESGHVPKGRLWDAARAWARGKPSKHEDKPQFLVSYPFIGRRYFLADGNDAVYVFSFPENAGNAAFRLEELGFEDVVVVPVWRTALRELERRGAQLNVFEDGPGTDSLAALTNYVKRLADQYHAKFGTGADPP